MHRIRTAMFVTLVAGLLSSGLAARAAIGGQEKHAPARTPSLVTPVAGTSWLNHLGITFRDTSLGRPSGHYGPGPNDTAVVHKPVSLEVVSSVSLTGADLYRLNCQACHHAEGTGAPPEVRSVLPAVQGSSLEMMRKQLQHDGRAVDEATARQRTREARDALYRRILLGGEKMPPHRHLRDADVNALYAYLTQLAGTPGTHSAGQTTVSWAQLGENVVKGTCHICHDAVGPHPTGHALLEGSIPALNVVLAQKSVTEFVDKVRSGAPVYMGEPPMHYRGRMPVFDYLKDEEIAAAYSFLAAFPPQAK